MSALPLAGKRVLVTRALHQAAKLSAGLHALGAVPVEVPVLQILPPESWIDLDRALLQFSEFDWLLLTSANTVQALFDRAHVLGIDLLMNSGVRVAAIGQATAKAARQRGMQIAFVPASYVAESLLERLTAEVAGLPHPPRVLLARAAVARDLMPDALRASGVDVEVVDAYRNAVPDAAPGQLREAMAAGIDVATFTSSSSAVHLAEVARKAGISWPLTAVPAVSIGPITSQTLRDLGWPPAAEAVVSDIPGLISAVAGIWPVQTAD